MGAAYKKAEMDWTAVDDLATALHLKEELEPRDNSWIRISGIHQCARQIAYRIKWYQEGRREPLNTAHLNHIFDVGHALHYHLQLRLSKHGVLGWVDADPIIEERNGRKSLGWAGNFERTVRSEAYRLRGTLDCLTEPLLATTVRRDGMEFSKYAVVPEGTPGGRRKIIDIKTISARENVKETAYGVERKPSAFEKLTEPKSEHLTQAMMYSWLVTQPGFQTDRIPGPLAEMPDVMIFYVAKDVPFDYYNRFPEQYYPEDRLLHAPYKVFQVEPDMLRVKNALTKTNRIWEALDRGELPNREYNHTPQYPNYHCQDCPFRAECYQEEGYFKDDDFREPLQVIHGREQLRSPNHGETHGSPS